MESNVINFPINKLPFDKDQLSLLIDDILEMTSSQIGIFIIKGKDNIVRTISVEAESSNATGELISMCSIAIHKIYQKHESKINNLDS